jgi:hypothetical protein
MDGGFGVRAVKGEIKVQTLSSQIRAMKTEYSAKVDAKAVTSWAKVKATKEASKDQVFIVQYQGA